MSAPNIHRTEAGFDRDWVAPHGDYLDQGDWYFRDLIIPRENTLFVEPGALIRARNIRGADRVVLWPAEEDGEVSLTVTEDIVVGQEPKEEPRRDQVVGRGFLQPEEIAKVIAASLKRSRTIKAYELQVSQDRGTVILTDDDGSMYRIDVIDCE